jgi:hypothetical protein
MRHASKERPLYKKRMNAKLQNTPSRNTPFGLIFFKLQPRIERAGDINTTNQTRKSQCVSLRRRA